MGLNILTLGSSKTYTDESLLGLGSLKGAPCTIKSITEVNGGQKVTFEWTGTSGTKQTSEMIVKNGVSVTGVSDKGNGTFTLLLSDGSESEPIHTVKGDPFTYSDFTAEQLESLRGEKGYSPTITENADNTDSIYKLDVTTADGTFTTPNLKGTNENGDTSNVQLDETLTDNTKAAPAGMVGEMKKEISSLSKDNANLDNRLKTLEQGGTGSTGLSAEAIDKLEEVGNYLAYTTADGGSKWTELISILRNGSSGGGSGETVPATGISLDKTTLSFTDSATQTLVATVEPSNTTDKVVWTSNAESVATVTNGVVKPLSNGSATITATCGSVSATCSVTVDIAEEEQVTLTSISATYTGGDVAVGTSLNDLTGITVTATYSDGSTSNVTGYTLSGEIVEGSNTITVSYGGKSTTFTVTGVAEEVIHYSITRNLTNYTSSSDVTTVVKGEAHNETLTVADGCESSNVTITMGGVDITSDVFGDGYILITEVTGDIVITAIANELVAIDVLRMASNTIEIYSDDGNTKVATKYYAPNTATKQIAYKDTELIAVITNNTEAEVSVGSIYAGMVAPDTYTGNHFYSVVGATLTTALGVGKSVQFKFSVKKGYRGSVVIDSTLDCVIYGDMGIAPTLTEYSTTTSQMNANLYSDAGVTKVTTKYYANITQTTESFDTDKELRISITNETEEQIDMNAINYYGFIQSGSSDIHYNASYQRYIQPNAPIIFIVTVPAGYKFAISKGNLKLSITDVE